MWSSDAILLGRAAALLMVSLVTGCGFRPSGVVDFPPTVQAVHVDTVDRYSVFYRELTTALRAGGRELVATADAADTVITISRDETGQRVLAVSARNVPREFDVYYIVRFAVERKGVATTEPQTLIRNRDYTFDETQILGKAREEEILREALAEALVRLVTRQVAALEPG